MTNSDEKILCVCFTNHALDQFLEHMLDSGENRIVRLGGRSKSDRIGSYQIENIAEHNGVLVRKNREIESSLKVLKERDLWNNLSLVLRKNYPVQYRYTHVPSACDGRYESDFLWNEWKKGKEFPPSMLPFMDDFPEGMDEFWRQPQQQRDEFVFRWRRGSLQLRVTLSVTW